MKLSKEQFRNLWMTAYQHAAQHVSDPTNKLLQRTFNATCIRNGLQTYHANMEADVFQYAAFVEQITKTEGFKPSDNIIYNVNKQAVTLNKLFLKEDSAINCAPVIANGQFDPAACYTHIEIYTADRELLFRLHRLVERFTLVSSNLKSINFIINSPEGITLAPINNFKTKPLAKENYPEYVLKGFDNMVAQIMSADPAGRLHLLEGPPGTGKTRFIASLVDAVNAKFLFVPVIEASSLLSPDFMAVLSFEVSESRVPIVIILEDSEALLQKRKKTGSVEAALISGILNLCDSPIAAGLNIHIISTFNSKLDDFDDAIKRKGRLATHIKFSNLSYEQANKVYQRETKTMETLTEERSYTLAEIYGALNETRTSYLPDDEKSEAPGRYN